MDPVTSISRHNGLFAIVTAMIRHYALVPCHDYGVWTVEYALWTGPMPLVTVDWS